MRALQLDGATFSRLTVIERVRGGQRFVMWKCLCECGNETIVSSGHLRSGHTKSCGCLKKDNSASMIRSLNTTHGMRNTRLYTIWSSMIQRCENPKHKSYAVYGGRGITVYPQWKEFNSFFSWAMSSGYQDSLTIDRENNELGYSPENCRWATLITQANNRRTNVNISFKGKVKTIS